MGVPFVAIRFFFHINACLLKSSNILVYPDVYAVNDCCLIALLYHYCDKHDICFELSSDY